MFKNLRFICRGLLVIALAAVAYHFLGDPLYQRKIVQKAEEVKEDLRDPKKARWSGMVVVLEAVDGDKLLVNTETSKRVRVILAGIDAPELGIGLRPGQALALESRAYLAQLTTNKAAEMMIIGTDASTSPLVLLQVEGALVNAKMLAAGLAERTTDCLQDVPAKLRHEMENAELTAQESRSGIWSLNNYMRPVEFRIRQN